MSYPSAVNAVLAPRGTPNLAVKDLMSLVLSIANRLRFQCLSQ